MFIISRLNNPASDASDDYRHTNYIRIVIALRIKIEGIAGNGNKANDVFCKGEESKEKND